MNISNDREEPTKPNAKVIGFVLGRGRRGLCGFVGLGLLFFGVGLALDSGSTSVVILSLILGAFFLLLAILGEFGSIGINAGSGKSIRVEPATPSPPDTDEGQPPILAQPSSASNDAAPTVEAPSPFISALDAWFAGDRKQFDEKMNDAIATAGSPESALNYSCMRLAYLYGAGETRRLDELRCLREENPTSLRPIYWIGHCFSEAENWSKAAEIYEDGAKDPRLSAADYVQVLIWLSEALRKSGRFDEALSRLETAIIEATTDTDRALLHVELGAIHGEAGHQLRKFWHLEQALILNAGAAETRFKLAFAYAEANNHLMAMYHYSILATQRGDGAELNNLAVAFHNLALPINAVTRYRQSIDKHYTLASANLARVATDAGMIHESEEILASALKEASIDAAVHSASAHLSQAKKDEEERVERMKAAAKTERDLLLEGWVPEWESQKLLTLSEIQGSWNFDFGSKSLVLATKGETLEGTFKEGVWDWTLTGTLDGRVLTFVWKNDHIGQNRSGDGFLVFDTETSFRGILRHFPNSGNAMKITGSRTQLSPASG
jgi:tetratricopeptide (TPR) repeat protein